MLIKQVMKFIEKTADNKIASQHEKKIKAFNAPSCGLDDFRTPAYLLDFIRLRWGLDYDAACTPNVNNVVPKTLRLEEEWPKKKWPTTIYSNPPFDTKSIIKWIVI